MIDSLVKPANLLLAGYSYFAGALAGRRATIMGMPVSISTELTNHCNLKCPECSSGSGKMTRKRGFMEIELFEKIITELRPFIYNINLYFQGESMMHPLFFSFLNSCRGLHSVVSSNGHYLSGDNAEKIVKSGLSKLIVSLDGADQDTYSGYRVNGNFNSVLQGIRSVSEAREKWKSPLKIEIQFLVNKVNEHQIPAMRLITKELKVSLKLKSMQIINMADAGLWLPADRKFRRYKMINEEFVNKNSLPDRCSRLWFSPVITWDGKVIPCCFDKDAEHVMGNVNQDSFREIWDGPKYRLFRKCILTDRSMTEICRNCTSGLRGVRY